MMQTALPPQVERSNKLESRREELESALGSADTKVVTMNARRPKRMRVVRLREV